ncbi:MAG: hypothetical protein IKV57_01730 [Clostridia bacterium]|nr:hypothetical protein [Clostridia bacterium]
MLIKIEKQFWSLYISAGDDGISFENGHFGELAVLPSPVFRMKLENCPGTPEIDSASGWGSVRFVQDDAMLKFWLGSHVSGGDITVVITGYPDEKGISWYTDVINDSAVLSVAEITYPTPLLHGEPLHLFIPDCCGRALLHAGQYGFSGWYQYPGHNMSMQYFAWWGQTGGIYLGIHDPDGCMKTFGMEAAENTGRLHIAFPAIGAGCAANSFSPAGYIRWEAFQGDWYDATMLYAAFVHTSAHWLPVRGRPDTPQRFKEIPYWICDYIPNSEKQMEARPMTLATVSERYGKDYWIDAAAALKKRLGTPVGYHVYNWHEIPFNINYPHFLPARDTARDGFIRLKEAGLYVFPYINAVSWEMDDGDERFTENFGNTGIQGAVLHADGSPLYVHYPQKKANGQDTRLAPICPTFPRWHQIINDVARGMEETLAIDGIYFDQIAAVPAFPCRNPAHSHRPGGGSYWSDGYCLMMEKINAAKPENTFYFSESNAETYIKAFDGFLTWVWTMGDDVPAFPAVYAGYIQMLGRYTDGAKRDDDVYFRYHLAEGLLFGQQLGWLNAHVVYNEERMRYLEQLVHMRYRYSDLFSTGFLLRPPHTETNIPLVASSGITMRQVVSGVWQTADREKTVLFIVNLSTESADVDLRLYPEEYGALCPETLHLTMPPMTAESIEYARKI